MFLRQIASVYCTPAEIDNLGRYCFVFPNRRSSLFFRRYLLDEFNRLGRPAFIPSFTTISDLVARYSPGAEASRYEQLFALYESYRHVLEHHKRSEQIRDFDRFRFWGEMILNDFNDIDRYLVDADALFTNVTRLKEISADYLTDEQREIIQRFWGEDDQLLNESGRRVDIFWEHTATDGNDESLRARFLSLWELLSDLYHEFRKTLSQRKLNYSGMAYREAAEKIRHIPPEELPYKRYIFVGFNVLSNSELKIFERLQHTGMADFYWDFASPAFYKQSYPEVSTYADVRSDMINRNNSATRFIGRNVLKFPSLYPLPLDLNFDSQYERNINVLAVPGNTVQTKEAERILNDAVRDGSISTPDDAIDTCVVVNDDSLFVPLLHSLPEDITAVNITMGLPKRHTEIATLMSAVFALHARSRNVSGRKSYFFEDVLAILNHPIVLAVAPADSFNLRNHMVSGHLFTIPASDIAKDYNELSFIFTDVDPTSADAVYAHLTSLLDTLATKLDTLRREGTPLEGTDRQLDIIGDYRRSIDEIENLIKEYNITLNEGTYMHLIESMINSSTLNFAGMPLKGLQVMNMLETRALDFNNLVMLSMNERIFPRKSYAPTFIPNALRSGFGMSTIDHQESMFAYYFYRLLTRARNVHLLYDSRTTGLSSGEMSRYLYQLKYLNQAGNVTFRMVDYVPSSPETFELSVDKNPDELKEFLAGGHLNLSASALKTFAACPLKFYLQYVRRWSTDEDDTVKEYMTPIVYGNVVHHVAQRLFEKVRGEHDTVTITADLLDKLKTMPADDDPLTPLIEQLIHEEINKEFHNLPNEKARRPLRGQARLLADIMLKTVRGMLDAEKTYTPFEFYRAEYGGSPFEWKLSDTLTVRFKMSIDRVDIMNEGLSLRFIDYKTGSDGVVSGKMETLASRAGDHKYSAVFQLMTYAMAYTDISKDPRPVQPFIYKLGKIMTEGLQPVRLSDKSAPVTSHLDHIEAFRPGFIELVERIFDPSEPFKQCAKGDSACSICRFSEMCSRFSN